MNAPNSLFKRSNVNKVFFNFVNNPIDYSNYPPNKIVLSKFIKVNTRKVNKYHKKVKRLTKKIKKLKPPTPKTKF
jgi:hypothetical protein